jgi:acyl dehydratase
MSDVTRIELDGVPSLALNLGRVLVHRKSGSGSVPAMESHVAKARIDPRRLRAYCDLLGVGHHQIPVVFPQTIATAVAFEMLLSDAFPFSIPGLIHLRCQLCEQRPLHVDEELEVTCGLEGHRDLPRGRLVTVDTRINVGDETPWRSSNDILSPVGRPRRTPRPRSEPRPATDGARTAHWDLPASIGRRFARVSGDYNPIHLFALTARFFGFRRAIAHGLWTLSRSLVEIGRDMPCHPFEVEAEFKRPLYLPSRVRFECNPQAGGVGWEVCSTDGTVLHLIGRASPT